MNEEIIMPTHVGIIMDGNGRWAKERGMIRSMGHKAAIDTIKELCTHMSDVGLKYCSVYAFSTENFKREKAEVDFLMDLFTRVFDKGSDFLIERNIKVIFSGRKDPLPEKVLKAMNSIVEKTKNNTGLVFNVCINYGSHSEIVDTTKKICEMYKNGEIDLESIDEDLISKNLYQDLPPLDFVIRTSGELRLSNFMMWQASYAEFYFPKTYFPDFNGEEFDKAILEFNKRNRRFGDAK